MVNAVQTLLAAVMAMGAVLSILGCDRQQASCSAQRPSIRRILSCCLTSCVVPM